MTNREEQSALWAERIESWKCASMGDRRIVVGADFDETALRRLIGALERLAC